MKVTIIDETQPIHLKSKDLKEMGILTVIGITDGPIIKIGGVTLQASDPIKFKKIEDIEKRLYKDENVLIYDRTFDNVDNKEEYNVDDLSVKSSDYNFRNVYLHKIDTGNNEFTVTIKPKEKIYTIRIFEAIPADKHCDTFKECDDLQCVTNRVIENLTEVVESIKEPDGQEKIIKANPTARIFE